VSVKSLISGSRSRSALVSEAARSRELLPKAPNKPFTKSAVQRPSRKRVTGKAPRPSDLKRILIVDDVADVTEMIALFLKHAGFDVATANSARSALLLSSENQFDLVISDIGMPEMNGYDLAESLRQSEHYQQTPMIAVTGYTEYDDSGRSLAAGFNAHLTKPINPAHLLNVIGELLG
jgi:CheY-like chemotaxis protein